MLTFQEAKAIVSKARQGRKKIGNNTYLEDRGDAVAVRLHNTDVVLINKDGTYTLDSGGWRTVTTKDRINQYSPVKVYQKMGNWFLNDGGEIREFTDGITVSL